MLTGRVELAVQHTYLQVLLIVVKYLAIPVYFLQIGRSVKEDKSSYYFPETISNVEDPPRIPNHP